MPAVTQAEFARLLGVARPYVNSLVSKGVLTLDAAGKLDYDASVAALKTVANPGPQLRHASENDTPLMQEIRASALDAPADGSAAPAADTALPADGVPQTYQQARALREKFAAMNERLKFEAAIGRLIDAAGADAAIQTALAELRGQLDLLPDRLTAELPADLAQPLRLALTEALDSALNAARARLETLLAAAEAPDEIAA